jgi:Flp pilus assembly protein TadB
MHKISRLIKAIFISGIICALVIAFMVAGVLIIPIVFFIIICLAIYHLLNNKPEDKNDLF